MVATSLRGNNLRSFRHHENGEIAIKLMFENEVQSSLDKLKALPIKRSGNQQITLDMVAETKIKLKRNTKINEFNRQASSP